MISLSLSECCIAIMMSAALAMDCFTVSVVAGFTSKHFRWPIILRTSTLFGLFQALMPLGGWLGMRLFRDTIERVDHWIAFLMRAFIGGKMIWESFGSEEETSHTLHPEKWFTAISLAIATSIDAMAVGISYACTGTTMDQLVPILFIIGIGSLLFSIMGWTLGILLGGDILRRWQPERIGGTILILIGCKILFSHLYAEGVL